MSTALVDEDGIPLADLIENNDAETDAFLTTVGRRELENPPPTFDSEFYDWKRDYWLKRLRDENITKILAPMVEQSELAFRMMMKEHGAHISVTPMIHAQLFVSNLTYRKNAFKTVEGDRPLIVQFCGNDPDVLLNACRLVEGYCDGVDLNLGCPQMVARRGHYGSFLQDEPELISEMVQKVFLHCRLPLSVKIRILESADLTLKYALMIQNSGASMLTVHGRTREQRGVNTGIADWERLRQISSQLRIPVVANGNIQMPGDIEKCLDHTGAAAVMSAEGLLSNPLLFEGRLRPCYEVAAEYLDFARRYKAPTSSIRAHLFRICHYSLLEFSDLREKNSYVSGLDDFTALVEEIRTRCEKEASAIGDYSTFLNGSEESLTEIVSKLPHFLCKPYVRPAQRATNEMSESEFRERRRAELEKIQSETGLSFRQIRKRERRRLDMKKGFAMKEVYPQCQRCKQPAGKCCETSSCKRCCRLECIRSTKSFHHLHGEPLEEKRRRYLESRKLKDIAFGEGDFV